MQPLQLGILGVSGFFQKRIAIPVAQSPLIDLVAIASRSQDKAAQAAQEYGITRSYSDYESLLADEAVEAVYIPLPNHLHAPWIKKAADAGKHILCEKPIALNAEEARESIAYATGKGSKVMEAFMYRFHPQWRHARKLIRMRELGTVQFINVFFGYNNNNADNIRNQKEAGGGALLDVGCYAVSASRFLLGDEPQRVLSVAQIDKSFETDVVLTGLLDFGAARSSFTVATQTFPYQRVDVHGTSGVMTIDIPFNTHADVEARLTVTNSVGTREVYFEPVDQYILEFESFARAVRGEQEVPTPPVDATQNMEVLDALRASYESEQWVAVKQK